MKIRDVDKIFYTLPDKMENFTGQRVDNSGSQSYIRRNFPNWQYNGADEFDNILIWCEQHLGNNFVWNWETIYFKTEQDRTVFLLRWA
jgi:hypothetical protein